MGMFWVGVVRLPRWFRDTHPALGHEYGEVSINSRSSDGELIIHVEPEEIRIHQQLPT